MGGRSAIDLVIEEEASFIRIVFHERNLQNKIKIFLLDSIHSEEPITQSTTDRQIQTMLNARRKPYTILIVYQNIEPHDACPLFDFHIAVKPVSQIPHEHLKCLGYHLPDTEYSIDPNKKTTKIETYGAFSSDWLN